MFLGDSEIAILARSVLESVKRTVLVIVISLSLIFRRLADLSSSSFVSKVGL